MTTPGRLIESISWEHNLVHQGRCFVSSEYDADTDIAGPKRYLIITPLNGPACHMRISMTALAAAAIQFYSTPTKSANGTVLTALNRNLLSSNVSGTRVYKDPTVSVDGTLLIDGYTPGLTTAPLVLGGQGVNDMSAELILAKGTIYHLKITTIADNNRTNVVFNWYEDD